jgi:hypothetical protein
MKTLSNFLVVEIFLVLIITTKVNAAAGKLYPYIYLLLYTNKTRHMNYNIESNQY